MMKIANEYLVKLKRLANKETEILLPMDFTNLEEVLKGLENFVNKK